MRKVELAFGEDTTGSMYACHGQVRRKVKEVGRQLSRDIPGIGVGMIAFGDYCDAGSTYVTSIAPLSTDIDRFCNFVSTVSATGGGDAPECYELVLHEARSLGWTADAAKAFVLIGDDVPHEPSYPQNTKRLDWMNEALMLKQMGVPVFAVQALNRTHATSFYRNLAEITGGAYLTLDQFAIVPDLIMAIAYRQAGADRLGEFEQQVVREGRMNRNMDEVFQTLSGVTPRSYRFKKERDLEAVPPGRFQILFVDHDQPIRQYVQEQGLIFQTGRGFYQLNKTETIQPYKEVILRQNPSGDLFTGEKARELLGLPRTGNIRGRFKVPDGFTAFVQSKSYNRNLKAGTEFLYEVDSSR